MRPIGKADVEFYESRIVLVIAETLGAKPLNSVSYRSKQRRLNIAVDVAHRLLNDVDFLDRMRLFLKQRESVDG
jgi:hypothetical protein